MSQLCRSADSRLQYEIRVKGHLASHWSQWFEGFAITLKDNGETLLSGPVADQAALYGVLIKIRNLGLPLISVMPAQVMSAQTENSNKGESTMTMQSRNVRSINVQKQMLTISMKAKLSALWIFFLFNIIFRDIHEFVEPGFIEEIMTGTSNGNPITEQMLLLGGVMIEVPIAMVLLSRLLPYGANRWANIIVAAIYGVLITFFGTTDLDDVFHLVMESAALSFIIWSAWRWRNFSPKKQLSAREEAI